MINQRLAATSPRGLGKDISMRFMNTNIATADRVGPAFVGSDSRASRPIPMRLLNSSSKGRQVIPTRQEPPMVRGEAAEILADIDGLPILVRFLVQDAPAELRSGAVAGDADIHSLLSSTLEKVVDRMRGSPLRRDDPKRQRLAIVELTSNGVPSARLPTCRMKRFCAWERWSSTSSIEPRRVAAVGSICGHANSSCSST